MALSLFVASLFADSLRSAYAIKQEQLKQISGYRSESSSPTPKLMRSESVAAKKVDAEMPCQCQNASKEWTPPSRKEATCVFIDLGANKGNTFEMWQKNYYVNLKDCPGTSYEAWLVEANPKWSAKLWNLSIQSPKNVHDLSGHLVDGCDATSATFYIDDWQSDGIGSSISPNHAAVKKSSGHSVSVPVVNINRILYENTIKDDLVILKMDIEGAEYNVVPCLAKSRHAALIDKLFMEVHPREWALKDAPPAEEFRDALETFKKLHIEMPPYNTPFSFSS